MKPPRRRPAAVTATARIIEAGDGLTTEAFTGRAAEVIADKERHIEKLAPLAQIGEEVKGGPSRRKMDKARVAFLELGRNLLRLHPRLSPDALLAREEVLPYLREFGDTPYRWVNALYPKRPRGHPPKI